MKYLLLDQVSDISPNKMNILWEIELQNKTEAMERFYFFYSVIGC